MRIFRMLILHTLMQPQQGQITEDTFREQSCHQALKQSIKEF